MAPVSALLCLALPKAGCVVSRRHLESRMAYTIEISASNNRPEADIVCALEKRSSLTCPKTAER